MWPHTPCLPRVTSIRGESIRLHNACLSGVTIVRGIQCGPRKLRKWPLGATTVAYASPEHCFCEPSKGRL